MTPEITVRPCAAAEWPAFVGAMASAFGSSMNEDGQAQWLPFLDFSRMLVATDRHAGGEQIVGTAGWLPLDMTVPGTELLAAAVTMVTVRPTHRRRGILRQLMRRQLDDAHAQGFAVAALWASEAIIYQRFGYGVAFLRNRIDLHPRRAAFLGDPGPVGQPRLISHEEALEVLPAIYDRLHETTPASFRRSRLWWEKRTLCDLPAVRHGGSELFRMVLTIDGQPEGYALYRTQVGWGADALPTGSVEVLEAVGATPTATREVWRYLFGIDLVAHVRTFRLNQGHPLLLALTDPRQLRLSVGDGTWIRLVDMAKALEARRYGSEAVLTFQLLDAMCPWNDGVWTLDAGPDGATVRRSEATPELRLSAAELSAMYLGTVSASSLLRAGRIDELAVGAARRADALFGWDVPPWCLDDF